MSDQGIPDIQFDQLDINTSQRLPCVLLLDGSGSMSGTPIDELNNGLRILEEELKKDDIASQRVQLLVVRFGDDKQVQVLMDWTDAMSFSAPKISANGNTPMGGAVRLALAKLEEQKERYRAKSIPYNCPWVFVITDGEPTDDWEQAAAACLSAEREGHLTFFGIGVGSANLGTLSRFSDRAPALLSGLKFKELFVWLGSSVRTASKAKPRSSTQMPNPSSWMNAPS